MAPNPQCSALAAAKTRSGLSYGDIATKIGIPEQQVINICTGSQRPTTNEFDALARVLGVTASSAPHDAAHATQ